MNVVRCCSFAFWAAEPLCASAGSGMLHCVVRYAASMRRGGRGYPGMATLPVGAESG